MFPPRRIVGLTEEAVETLHLLGEEDRIVGGSGFVVRPSAALTDGPDELQEIIRGGAG